MALSTRPFDIILSGADTLLQHNEQRRREKKEDNIRRETEQNRLNRESRLQALSMLTDISKDPLITDKGRDDVRGRMIDILTNTGSNPIFSLRGLNPETKQPLSIQQTPELQGLVGNDFQRNYSPEEALSLQKVLNARKTGLATDAQTKERLAGGRLDEQRAFTEIEKRKLLSTKEKSGAGTASQQRQALSSLQGSLIQESKALDAQLRNFQISEEEHAQKQTEIAEELALVRTELKNIGKVKELENPEGGKSDRITTLKTMKRKNLINQDKYNDLVRDAFEKGLIDQAQAVKALRE